MLYNSIGVPSWVCRCLWYRGVVPVQVPLLPMAHQAPGGWRRLHLWRLVEFRRPIMAHAMALQTVDGGEILPLIDGLSMVIPLFIGFQHVSTIQDWWLAGFRNHPQFNIYICAEKPPNYRYLMTFGECWSVQVEETWTDKKSHWWLEKQTHHTNFTQVRCILAWAKLTGFHGM